MTLTGSLYCSWEHVTYKGCWACEAWSSGLSRETGHAVCVVYRWQVSFVTILVPEVVTEMAAVELERCTLLLLICLQCLQDACSATLFKCHPISCSELPRAGLFPSLFRVNKKRHRKSHSVTCQRSQDKLDYQNFLPGAGR